MAIVARYVFPDRGSAEAAANRIRNEIGSGSCYQSGDEVEIDSECRDVARAGEICRAHGGRAK